jgi:poly(A) polymerase
LVALFDSGWGELLLPEVAALDLEQGGRHLHKDNLRHSLQVCAQAVPRRRVRWAALLHDVGKASTRQITGDKVTFYHHEAVGRRLAEQLLVRLGYTTAFAEEVGAVVELSGRTHAFDEHWSDSAIRRFITDAGEYVDDVLDLSRADCTSRRAGRKDEVRAQVDAVAARIAGVREADARQAVRPALDGQAIMALLGLEPSPEVGRAYRWLLGFAQAGEILTVAEAEQRLVAWWATEYDGT